MRQSGIGSHPSTAPSLASLSAFPPMFFRFGSAVCLVVLVSLIGIAIEKRSLELRRELSRQHYQMDVLRDRHARLRLKSQELARIERLFDHVEQNDSELTLPDKPTEIPRSANARDSYTERYRRLPPLFWRQPFGDLHAKDRDDDHGVTSP